MQHEETLIYNNLSLQELLSLSKDELKSHLDRCYQDVYYQCIVIVADGKEYGSDFTDSYDLVDENYPETYVDKLYYRRIVLPHVKVYQLTK